MRNQKRMIGIVLLAVGLCVMAAAAPINLFHFRNISASPTASATDTYAINNAGVIAGDYVDASGVQHGMILAGGKLTTVDRPDCTNTPASTSIAFYGINSAGVAAGWCLNTSGVEIAFLYHYGTKTFININIPGATLTNANGINDNGLVVGTYIDSSGVQHGFSLAGTKVTNLDPPNVTSTTTAWGVNNQNVITVWGLDSSGDYRSFTTSDNGKNYSPFSAPGEGPLGTAIHEINNNGDIIATYFDSSSNRHGVLFHGGNYYSFDDPNPNGPNNTRGDGLNDTLDIVGRYGTTVNGTGYQAVYSGN